MGLDSMVYAVSQDEVIDDFGFNGYDQDNISFDASEIFYARKNFFIHEWMKDLYYRKGGKLEMFNGEFVRIVKKDLELFDQDLLHEMEYGLDEYQLIESANFIRTANIFLDEGKALYYYSSW